MLNQLVQPSGQSGPAARKPSVTADGPDVLQRRPIVGGLRIRVCLAWVLLCLVAHGADATAGASTAEDQTSRLIEAAGTIEFRGSGADTWHTATNGLVLRPGDRVRTGPESRAAVQLADRSILRLGERTTLELQVPRQSEKRRFGLLQGLLFFFNRERPSDVEFETPIVTGAIRGTEFVLEAGGMSGMTRLALFDGQVELAAQESSIRLGGGEQAIIEPGKAPVKSPLLDAVRIIQWALYYPAVVVPEDIGLSGDDAVALAPSMAAYRDGDLLAAHRAASSSRGNSTARDIFLGALDLAVGRLDLAESRLAGVAEASSAPRAMRELIAVVRGETSRLEMQTPETASEWLARSYTLQGRFRLLEALEAANTAAGLTPDFGFVHARVAELELGFGHRAAALSALERALRLSPRLAQAHALRGFVLLEEGKPRDALDAFDRAIHLDAALGSAWLGRGLALLRLRLPDEALRSLQAAVAMEPRRAVHRSYLAKGFGNAGETGLTEKELRLAKELDPADPTAWLYSALQAWEGRRPNKAVHELERSVALNDNRQVFRSRMLLDRDLAVRSANLAALYGDAGLPEVSLRAASSAVLDDYANFSGHLFLANSYQAFEDPNRFDLRYETARQSELLIANLLAPPGGANLSHLASQQEHLQYFDPRPLGLSSLSEYRSGGEWRQETAAYGSLAGFSYALDSALEWRRGQDPNGANERRDVSLQLKQGIDARDELYLQAGIMDASAGDTARHYDPDAAKPGLKVREDQMPGLHLGWHRAWTPEQHSLLLVARWTDDLRLHDNNPGVLFLRQTDGATTGVSTPPFFELDYANRFTLYSGEFQHVWQSHDHTLVTGTRGQWGEIDPDATLSRPITGTVTHDHWDTSLTRVNAYAYHHWRIAESVRLVTGLSYDRLTHPSNTEIPPLQEGRVTRDLVEPKAGLEVRPWTGGVARAAYSQSLGGVYFDNSVRLEPTQIAGFNQAFRSLLPESAAGLVPGTAFETANLGFDQTFRHGTYAGVEVGTLRSDGDRVTGVLTNSLPLPIPDSASGTRQTLRFREDSVSVYVVQLLGEGLSLGIRHRLGESRLDTLFPDIPASAAGHGQLEARERSVLHQTRFSLNYQHDSGVFCQWESTWLNQGNRGYNPERPGDDAWQHDVHVGYRWPRRRAELRAGVLNLAGSDYRLNPLSSLPPLVRERTAVISLRLHF